MKVKRTYQRKAVGSDHISEEESQVMEVYNMPLQDPIRLGFELGKLKKATLEYEDGRVTIFSTYKG